MQVSNAFELGTTIGAWLLYQQTIEVLTMTGLIVVPFAIVIWKNSREPSESQEEKAAWLTSLNKMKWDLVTMAMVVTLTVLPTRYPLDLDLDPANGSKHSTNEKQADDSARPPYWWQLMLGVSAGINSVMIKELPPDQSIRAALSMTQEVYLDDPALRNEVRAFRDDCYIPARGKFFDYARQGKYDVDSLKKRFGKDAFSWMGGKGFLGTQGLYLPCTDVDICGNTLRASQPVAGWPVERTTTINSRSYARDVDKTYSPEFYSTQCAGLSEAECQAQVIPDAGKPFCSEWWDHPERGLKQKIVQDQGVLGRAKLFSLDYLFTDQTTNTDDLIVKAALSHTPSSPVSTNLIDNLGKERSDDPYSTIVNGVTGLSQGLVSTIGTTAVHHLLTLTSGPMVQALPIVQSYLLFALVVALPWMLFIGEYQLQALWYASVAYFTIRFWTVLWNAVQWVDQKLLAHVIGTDTGSALGQLLDGQTLYRALTGDQSTFALIEIITMTMYLVLPLIFSGFMAVVGYRVGGAIGGITSIGAGKLSAGAQKSGDTGMKAANQIATKGMSGASK